MGLTILYLMGLLNSTLMESSMWQIGLPGLVLYFCFLSLRFTRLRRRLLMLGMRSAWAT